MKQISSKLLSLVLGEEVTRVELANEPNYLDYHYKDSEFTKEWHKYLNLDTITRLMKEWCFWKGYNIYTKMRISDIYRSEQKIDYGCFINYDLLSWWNDSEYEAVLQATELVANKEGLL